MPQDIKKDFERALKDGVIPKDIDQFKSKCEYSSPRRNTVIELFDCIFKTIKENAEKGKRTKLDHEGLQKILDVSKLPGLTGIKVANESGDPTYNLINERIFGSSTSGNKQTWPILGHFIENYDPGFTKGQLCIDVALWSMGLKKVPVDDINALQIRTSELNNQRFPNGRDFEQRQGGVSILGHQTTLLIRAILEQLIKKYPDEIFETTHDSIKSYGDFIIMCLPNNLWVSVKSKHAKERLMASGYSNDLVGIGFFENPKDFHTSYRLRNYKKVGFLAIYLPTVPASEKQSGNGTNTYSEVMKALKEHKIHNYNINGKPFYRPFERFATDMEELLQESDRHKRSTIGF